VDVLVIGGGVAGLTVALELADTGRQVRVLDAGDFEHGTSHGNAGLLCPSYVTPIASPKVLFTALGWLIRRDGPFTLARAPWRADTAPWLARFLAACAKLNGPRATAFLAGLAQESIEWYDAFAKTAPDFGFARDGWLYVYATRNGLDEGIEHANAMDQAGVRSEVMSGEAAVAKEPCLRLPAGAVYYPDDAHLDSHAFIAAAVEACIARGVELDSRTVVRDIKAEAAGVRVATDGGEIVATDVVLAGGYETAALARKLGARLPILPARGHSVTLATPCRPRLPLLLSEAHLVVTPMQGHVRMTTGLELGASGENPDPHTAAAMALGAGKFFVDANSGYRDPWVGFRPLTPDGLPIVGRLAVCPRVVMTSGYGALGMTLAPAVARFVREIVAGGQGPELIAPKRFRA
jgi:D-amino-acid dehydrogenase